ncbi:MAG TPA: hypothetical protein VIX58_10135, partial [Anaerolineae bacterium]
MLILVSVAWLFAVTFAYYTVHKPFEIYNVLSLANVAGDVLTAIVLFASGAALGFRIIRRFEFALLE